MILQTTMKNFYHTFSTRGFVAGDMNSNKEIINGTIYRYNKAEDINDEFWKGN